MSELTYGSGRIGPDGKPMSWAEEVSLLKEINDIQHEIFSGLNTLDGTKVLNARIKLMAVMLKFGIKENV